MNPPGRRRLNPRARRRLTVGGTLGVAALLAPGLPLLKEWAYAGFTFNLVGATASHVFGGDPISETIRPAIILALGAASYHWRPASRRLFGGRSEGAGAAIPGAPAGQPARGLS